MSDYQKVSSYEADPQDISTVVLLYSGGLDSSVMIKWIQKYYDANVITLTIDLGQQDDLESIRRRALALGAKKALVADAVEQFANEYLVRAIKANASYQGRYYLSTPLGRPLITSIAVQSALEHGAEAIAHGCTGKGNDQVRFDAGVLTLAPALKIIAPVREFNMTREQELAFAEANDIPLSLSSPSVFSHDENIWGSTSEGGDIEDTTAAAPISEALRITTSPQRAPDEAEEITITFKKGVPIALNGHEKSLVPLIQNLNSLGSTHGIGICVLIEDRIFGSKSRGIYEAPAAELLITAHRELEKAVCTQEELELKSLIDQKWAHYCYHAKWFHPVMSSLNAVIENINQRVSGTVTLHLYKGTATPLSVESEMSLFDSAACGFNESTGFNVNCAAPFIEFYAASMVQAAAVSPTQTTAGKKNEKTMATI